MLTTLSFRRWQAAMLLCCALLGLSQTAEAALPIVRNVALQPLAAQVKRLIEANDFLGEPLAEADRQALYLAMAHSSEETAIETIQNILDKYCLAGVTINPESRVKAVSGAAKPELVEQGWRRFIIKVLNEGGVTAPLRVASPQALANGSGGWYRSSSDVQLLKPGAPRPAQRDMWMDLQTFENQPMRRDLSGLAVEYRILQIYSRDSGQREAKLMFNVGQGTQDLGFRSDLDVLFTAQKARDVQLRVRDENDKPTTASFIIRDPQGRVYPSQAKRLAPDFAFHPQVYRADGEEIKLPEGTYNIEFSRGPESYVEKRTVKIDRSTRRLEFKVQRWIDPSLTGWWSGDHHIHAAGCAHYTNPTEGVHAPDMMRHCMGEDLKIGANLTWGPCFDYQKQFFTGRADPESRYPYILRYDIEVSGFGSHESGHLCLLRLKDQMYPGGESKHHWPSLGLNTLRWAKAQGAITGPAHSGWGLEVQTSELPNYIVPPYQGIGANEYIVDVTHEVPGPGGRLVPAVDFMSTVDTPYVWELNMWYHTLNAGFRTRISGETDFPCIYGEKVGLGRSYVKLEGKLDYDRWCEGIREGRSYVSDGKSHLMEFSIQGGAGGSEFRAGVGLNRSEMNLRAAGPVTISIVAAALLNEKPSPEIKNRPYAEKPYWDVERARVGETRQVPVEVIVNGYPVAQQLIVADGSKHSLTFPNIKIDYSSWVAVRILPSSHTNPIFVLVDGLAIRPSRRSAEWCLKGVDQCWSQKERFIKPAEMEDAKKAYDHAREVYRRIVAESRAD